MSVLAESDGPEEQWNILNFAVGDQLDLSVDLGFLENSGRLLGETQKLLTFCLLS